jgi:hypothetical protein
MKTFTNMAAQGDFIIFRVDTIPENLEKIQPDQGYLTIQGSDDFGRQAVRTVMKQFWYQVGDQVEAQVWAQVKAQVKAQVRDQVWDQVLEQVLEQVEDQVWDQVQEQTR